MQDLTLGERWCQFFFFLKNSVQSCSKGFYHIGEWNWCFANQKAVNRDALPPGWQSAEKYLSFLCIKLQFVFRHPFFLFSWQQNSTFSIALSADSRSSEGMSRAQNHRQKSGNRCRTFEWVLPTVWCRQKRGGGRALIPVGHHRQEESPLTKNVTQELVGTYKKSKENRLRTLLTKQISDWGLLRSKV